MYKDKKIIITGGLGFIGSNLAIRLNNLGAKITIIDAKVYETGWNDHNIDSIKNTVEIIQDNISSKNIIPYIKSADYIFNLAGVLSHIDAMRDPVRDLEINAVDQLKLILSCLNSNPDIKIIYTGTRNQYGRAKYLPVKEDHPFDPIDTNGVSEVAAEMYHHLYYKLYGLKTVSLRLCNVFGPRHQMRHSRQGVLNWFIRQLIDGDKIQLMGNGSQLRDCVYVEDVVDALILLGEKEDVWGKSFNIGAYPITLKEFVEAAIKVYGKGEYEIVPFPTERQLIEPGDYIADYSKLRSDTNWSPKWKLEDAIKATFNFYEQRKEYYW